MNDEIVSPVFKIRDRKDEGTFLSIDLQYYGKLPDALGLGELPDLDKLSKKFIKRVKVDICWNTGSGSGNVTKIIPNDCMCEIENVILNYNLSVSGIPLSLLTSNYTACLQEINNWKFDQLQILLKEQKRIHMEALYAYNYEFEDDPCNDENYYAFKIRKPATLDEIKIIMVADKDAKIPTIRKEADISFKDVLKEILIYRAIDSTSSTVATMEDLANCHWLPDFFRDKTIETFKDIDLDKIYTVERLKKISEWINKLADAAMERGKQAEEEKTTAQELLVEETKKSIKRLRDLFYRYDKSDHKLGIRMEFYDICRHLLGAFEKN